jgi:lysophospholipase L1-like esterase
MLLLSLFPSSPSQTGVMPLRVEGDWSVQVGPGSIIRNGTRIKVSKKETLQVSPPNRVEVRDERIAPLPVFNPGAGGWRKGARLNHLITVECSATGLLYPETVRVKAASGEGPCFVRGSDYDMDDLWGTVGRLEKGGIGEAQPVFIDYDYSLSRLDSVVADLHGKVRIVDGTPGIALVMPPVLEKGEVALGNIWVPGRTEKITDENLLPIMEDHPKTRRVDLAKVESQLPKTLGKLRAGKPVRIVAWGDSVTDGGGVENHPEERYQALFARMLGEQFPNAKVDLLTAAWGGSSSRHYLEAPAGGPKDFVRDVLDPKPDLVTIEFVNDAYLTEEETQTHYAMILDRLQGNGSEVILITPHLVRPDWMGITSLKLEEDPRPYVKGLKRFASEQNVALADAGQAWVNLWKQGIPYVTLEANSINHPDARGHRIFADALMELFPKTKTAAPKRKPFPRAWR